MSARSSILTRLAGVLLVIGAFVGTNQITGKQLDALAVAALVVAVVCLVGAVYTLWVDFRRDPAANPVGDAIFEMIRVGSIVAGGLAIFGIWRTVVPDLVGPTYTNPVLGLSMIGLLVVIFFLSRPTSLGWSRRTVRARLAAAAGSAEQADPAGTPPAGGPRDGAATGAANGATTSADGAGDGSGGGQLIRPLTVIGTLVAIAVVLGYAWVIATLMGRAASAAEPEWSRLAAIQAGLEAAAFAALGALIGVTIQGRSTDAARSAAAQASADRSEAEQQAAAVTQENAALKETVRNAASTLTSVEREHSDASLPSGLEGLDVDNLVANLGPSERAKVARRVRRPADDDSSLAQIRRVRDMLQDAL